MTCKGWQWVNAEDRRPVAGDRFEAEAEGGLLRFYRWRSGGAGSGAWANRERVLAAHDSRTMRSVNLDVQCQRTRLYLGDVEHRLNGVWTCRYCPDRETYELVRDPDLLALVERALAFVEHDFSRQRDQYPTRIWAGNSPECVFELV